MTGTTGFLGAFLLKQLLEDMEKIHNNEERKIYCLIRSKSGSDSVALERLKSTFEFYQSMYF